MPTKQPDDLVFQMLTDDGTPYQNGINEYNANGNYASAADEFYIQHASRDITLERMIVKIRDTSGMAAGEYGNLGAALTNGVQIRVVDDQDAVQLRLDGGVPVTSNADWGRLCYDTDLKTWGAGDEFLLVRYTFSRCGFPIYLPPGWRFGVLLNDDLTGLVSHFFMVEGTYGIPT